MTRSETVNNAKDSWATCPDCQGLGRCSRRLRKKVRLKYKRDLAAYEQSGGEGEVPSRPKPHLELCVNCAGAGLVAAFSPLTADREHFPQVAIIGAGIGGVALAVACLHRGIPFTLYERDSGFESRSQGYGLTLQQASKAIEGFGIFSLTEGVISTRHLVHTTSGKVVGEWGVRKWVASNTGSSEPRQPKRTNIHIARQSLRAALLEQLGDDVVQWNHQLVDVKQVGGVELSFNVEGEIKQKKADLVVGADGIRSVVRRLLIGEEKTPLRYLGCIVILGICPLAALGDLQSDLLDSATVFQTANGNERIYMMPYDSESVMWQLSFPMDEEDAKTLSNHGAGALKAEALHRCQWHTPIPQILTATLEAQVSGYPVYDRELLSSALLEDSQHVTLMGDAAHPMSPFKGQGANQALLDALSLARTLSKGCGPYIPWKDTGLRASVLDEFEAEMLVRSASKVEGSADAAAFLHSEVALFEGDEPRGRCLNK